MCTLTFIPTNEGYLVGMNRDELLTRPQASPPELLKSPGVRALYPREPSGGTWIACSSFGNTLALLNWNDAEFDRLRPKQISRGTLIPRLISSIDSRAAHQYLEKLNLHGIYPFRLVGLFPQEGALFEWRWNGETIGRLAFTWKRHHWFSSSLSDSMAEQLRGQTCLTAAAGKDPSAADWLGELHRSHHPEPGPYSICVHRHDAGTVSYTEIRCSTGSASMGYITGSPCAKQEFDSVAHMPLGQGGAVSSLLRRAIS